MRKRNRCDEVALCHAHTSHSLALSHPHQLTPMSSTQKLYRTLHDQLEHALHPAALKTINKSQSSSLDHHLSTTLTMSTGRAL